MRHVICRVPVHCCLPMHFSTCRMEQNIEVPDRFDMGGSNLTKQEQLSRKNYREEYGLSEEALNAQE